LINRIDQLIRCLQWEEFKMEKLKNKERLALWKKLEQELEKDNSNSQITKILKDLVKNKKTL